MIALKNILVGTDFGEAADMALSYGRELARAFGARLHLVHVVQDLGVHLGAPEYAASLGRLQMEVEESARKRANGLISDEDRQALKAQVTVATHPSAARAIVTYARDEQVNLIVLGTHGRTAVGRLVMGSVAERVTRTAPCPVLVVRHPEREFVLPDALQTVAHA
jgi:nucleotide-binding universal stress UspA family protein